MSIKTHTKTLQVRIKDRHAEQLRQMARSVNFVWNYVNELSSRSIRERGGWLGFVFSSQPAASGFLGRTVVCY